MPVQRALCRRVGEGSTGVTDDRAGYSAAFVLQCRNSQMPRVTLDVLYKHGKRWQVNDAQLDKRLGQGLDGAVLCTAFSVSPAYTPALPSVTPSNPCPFPHRKYLPCVPSRTLWSLWFQGSLAAAHPQGFQLLCPCPTFSRTSFVSATQAPHHGLLPMPSCSPHLTLISPRHMPTLHVRTIAGVRHPKWRPRKGVSEDGAAAAAVGTAPGACGAMQSAQP